MKRGIKTRTLLNEARVLVIIITTGIILAVEIVTLTGIMGKMTADLKARSVVTADEVAALLEGPLYAVDDEQASTIASALVSSGRISGIRLESSVTGVLSERTIEESSRWVPAQTRTISRGKIVVGTVTLFFSDREVVSARDQFLLLSVVIMLAVILSTQFLTRFILVRWVQKPLDSISNGINRIIGGDYTSVIPPGKYQDINRFILLVNHMAGSILAKNRQLLEANDLLEQRVSERTADLETSVRELNKALHDLEVAQNKLLISEKLSALGQLSAGIAHELNTPLGAIASSIGLLTETMDSNFTVWLEYYVQAGERERKIFLFLLFLALPESIKPPSGNDRVLRKEIQQKLERAGIADARELAQEISEMGFALMFDRLEPYLGEEWLPRSIHIIGQIVAVRKMTAIIQVAGNKAAVVVGALRSYLHQGVTAEPESVDIGKGIDTILTLLHNKIKHDIIVEREYRSGPAFGSASLFSQVWLNLVNNALQAMNYRGTITIRTETVERSVFVHIMDNGPGVPESIRECIFEPFFTTKEYGEGMGLGLDICRQIVEQFNGHITFDSRPGYTCFTVQLLAAE